MTRRTLEPAALVWNGREEGRSWRLSGVSMSLTCAISAIRAPADDDWKSKPYSLEASCSTEAFNRLVGWRTVGYHWSVVKWGGVVGAGDVDTLEQAKAEVEALI